MIQIQVNDAPVITALEALRTRMEHANDALDTVGNTIVEHVRLGFTESADPYGTPWLPLKNRQGQPLRDTGRLMNSITHRVTGNAVEIGTNVLYAPTHQFGAKQGAFGRTKRNGPIPWGDIPARPFFPDEVRGLPQDWQASILDVLGPYIIEWRA